MKTDREIFNVGINTSLLSFGKGHTFNGTLKRATAKVGRNNSCPCGSGSKFKKCHINSDVYNSYIV